MEMIFLKYKIDIKNNKKIKIFGENFVEKNKAHCILIINHKEYKLSSYINIIIKFI